MKIAIVYALFGGRAEAEHIAAQMVEQRLAACANLLASCTSLYRWEGRLERAEEVPVLFKTSLERRAALIAAIEAAHGYEVPAVMSWTAQTTADYARWVDAETARSAV